MRVSQIDKIKFHFDIFRHYILSKLTNVIKEKPQTLNNAQTTIPKVIHFVWFGGGEYPELIKHCMRTWDKLEGYEFKLWNEDNFPIEKYPFAQGAYNDKYWAMVSDVARLHALYYEGGIYIDTDTEIVQSFDPLLDNQGFICYQTDKKLSCGVIAATVKHPWIKLLLSFYKVTKWNKIYKIIANPTIVTKLTEYHLFHRFDGNETVLKNGIVVYPKSYFNQPDSPTDVVYAIQHNAASWGKKKNRKYK